MAFELNTVLDSGPSANRIDIVILGDGYTAAQIAAGQLDADAASLTSFLFGGGQLTDPFGRYASFFNVHVVEVVSNQSGADNPGTDTQADTALDATYYGDGVTERLLTVNSTKATSAMNDALAGTGISADMRFVAVNDTLYGGSGGSFAVFAAGNGLAREIALHEQAHTFAGLADQYNDPGGIYVGAEPSQPDVTADASGDKWAQWLGYDQPGIGVIGAYEGGLYHDEGIWRPSLDSKMRTLGEPFDAVGREQFVLDFYACVDPLDGHTPNAGVQRNVDAFAVQTIDPRVIRVDWIVNGVAHADGGEAMSLSGLGLEGGDFTITAHAYDPTDWVRLDRSSLEEDVSWIVINDGERRGSAAHDTLYVGSGDDTLLGLGGGDRLTGGAGADRLFGGGGRDTMAGQGGPDFLHGGAGVDRLVGGAGADRFYFDSEPGRGGDRLVDFTSGEDRIFLDDDSFGAFGQGGTRPLGASHFHAGASAADADDFILYDASHGFLYYDADGSGAGDPVRFALLAPDTALAAGDFRLVA